MKDMFLARAKENITASELLFENGLFNASANRAYYAAFHIAIYAIYIAGIEPNIDHKVVQTLFSDYYFNKRKVIPSKYKGYLKELQNFRNYADYKSGVSKNDTKQKLKLAKDFVEIIIRLF